LRKLEKKRISQKRTKLIAVLFIAFVVAATLEAHLLLLLTLPPILLGLTSNVPAHRPEQQPANFISLRIPGDEPETEQRGTNTIGIFCRKRFTQPTTVTNRTSFSFSG